MTFAQVDVVSYGMNRTDIGLPCRSLSLASADTFDPGSTEPGHGGVRRNHFALDGGWEGWVVLDVSWYKRLSASRLAVPIRPIWVGTIANSVLYGALVWLVLFAPGLIRQRSRAKRGRCVVCGYELAAMVKCPECGAEKEKTEGKTEALTAVSKPAATLPGGE